MRYWLLLGAFFCITSLLLAQEDGTVKQIRVFVSDSDMLQKIWSSGIDHEGSDGKIGDWMEFVAGDHELRQLTAEGISYEVIIEDLESFYASRLYPGPYDALGFGYGSMGGYYTLAEVEQQLDSLRLLFPNLVSQKQNIGISLQGRPIWAVKMTANVDVPSTRPQAHYNALTHAREPMGMMAILYFMWYLAQGYGINAEATHLLDTRELWFIPVVNPDGYEANRRINPNGGGMRRKNMRNVTSDNDSYGVDLNRNFGYQWGYDNSGSSPTQTSQTYRGTGPFSEPETQVLRDFCVGRNFKLALNYHTYSNLLIYPWGYIPALTPDSSIFIEYASEMTQFNRYTYGTATQLLYAVNGVSDDWMYGEQTVKNKIFAMTPEVGSSSDGFWPPTHRIFPLAIENLFPNLYLAWAAGGFPRLRQHSIVDANGNGYLERGENFNLHTHIRNKGLSSTENLSVNIQSLSPHVEFFSTAANLPTLATRRDTMLAFAGRVRPNAATGVEAKVLVHITLSPALTLTDTIRLMLGTPAVTFTDGAEHGTSNWNTGQGWATHSTAYSGNWSFTDSPFGNYQNNANNSLTLLNPISIPSSISRATLGFWTRWDIETRWDFGRVEVSSNSGTNWTALPGRYTKPASGSGTQTPTGTPGYDGVQATWVKEEMDLSAYAGRSVLIRFRLTSDGSIVRDGWYVDDITLTAYTPNFDTALTIVPTAFNFEGPVGQVFPSQLRIYNFTDTTIALTISDTTVSTSATSRFGKSGSSVDLGSILSRLRGVLAKAEINMSALTAARKSSPQLEIEGPEYTTIITDERGEGFLGSADIYRVQYQLRTVPFLGTFHDFRIVLEAPPDTNIIGFISIDTDQEFGTGDFPIPFGFGPTSRDAGSEREVFFDASGILIDSLLGLGRIPAGLVISTSTDTIVGTPFPLTITRDSVLTISTQSLVFGIRDEWLADPDRRMNVGVTALRFAQNANPFPDFAPFIGHGTIGNERGASWITQNQSSLIIPSGDSAVVGITALAARPPGTHQAEILLRGVSPSPIAIPVTMTVTALPVPQISVVPSTITDTLMLGDSALAQVQIGNTGMGELYFGIVDTLQTPWFSVNPPFGVVGSGSTELVDVMLRTEGLQPNTTYASHFLIYSDDPVNRVVTVPVTLTVTPIVSVRIGDVLPTSFALRQNYPNPFNPETRISFDLPTREKVILRMYNLLGQEVAILLQEELDAGRYEVPVRTDRLPMASGVYLYKLTAGAFVEVKKMVVMK